MGASWVPPGCLLGVHCTRRHVFLFNKTCLLVGKEDKDMSLVKEDMSSFSIKTYVSVLENRPLFFLKKKACLLVGQEDMSAAQEDMSAC